MPEQCSVAGLLCSSWIVHNEHHVNKGVHMCTWHQDILGHSMMIDFVVMSSDLQLYVLSTLERRAELSTDHHLVVSWLGW